MTKPIDANNMKELNSLSSTSLDYLKKAQNVLQSKLSRQDIAKETGIPYSTIRTMVSRPDRLNYTSWLNVMLLAEYHDRLERKDSENDNGPARLDLRNTSIVLNGKLFTDEKYQDMSTTAKLIYGYLIHPAQKRYRDEAGREYVCCYSSDLEQLANHTRATIRRALLELQEHGLLSDYKIRSRPQRYYVHLIAIADSQSQAH